MYMEWRQKGYSEKLEVFLLPRSLQDTPPIYEDWPNLKIGSSLRFQIIQSAVICMGFSTLRLQRNFWQRRDKYPCKRGSSARLLLSYDVQNLSSLEFSKNFAEALPRRNSKNSPQGSFRCHSVAENKAEFLKTRIGLSPIWVVLYMSN
jgi:hypothetical protein